MLLFLYSGIKVRRIVMNIPFEKPLVFLFIGFFLAIACQSYNPFAPEKDEAMTISTSFTGLNHVAAAHFLTRMELTVFAADMDTIVKVMEIDRAGASVSLQVPAGKNRTFAVDGWVGSVKLLSGSTATDLNSGEDQQINIVLRFVSPALIITPPDTALRSSSNLVLYISTRHIERLATAAMRIAFDPEVLALRSMTPCTQFLSQNGGQLAILHQHCDNERGVAEYFFSILPASRAVEGNGNLVELEFETLKNDSTSISVMANSDIDSNLGLYDHEANPVSVVSLNGIVRVQ